MLYEMRNKTEVDIKNEPSALKKWLLLNGADTVKKFQQYEENGFDKPLKFCGNIKVIIYRLLKLSYPHLFFETFIINPFICFLN